MNKAGLYCAIVIAAGAFIVYNAASPGEYDGPWRGGLSAMVWFLAPVLAVGAYYGGSWVQAMRQKAVLSAIDYRNVLVLYTAVIVIASIGLALLI
jgi:hypothetical protein